MAYENTDETPLNVTQVKTSCESAVVAQNAAIASSCESAVVLRAGIATLLSRTSAATQYTTAYQTYHSYTTSNACTVAGYVKLTNCTSSAQTVWITGTVMSASLSEITASKTADDHTFYRGVDFTVAPDSAPITLKVKTTDSAGITVDSRLYRV